MKFMLPAIFFVATLALRWPILLAHLDTWYPFEIHSGSLAVALLSGIELDLPTTPIVPHARGGVLFALFAAPLYSLIDVSASTLKLLPWIWHALTVALLVGVVQRFFSRPAALFVGLLQLLAPPMYQKLSVLGLASHMESSLLIVLAWIPFFRMTIERKVTVANAFAFGLAVGFAGFFHLQALLPCLVLTALWTVSVLDVLVSEWRQLRPWRSVALVLGIAITAAPSWLFRLGNVALLQVSLGKTSAEAGPESTGAVTKLIGLVRSDFVAALEFGEVGSWGLPLGILFSVALSIAAAIAVWDERAEIVNLIKHSLTPWRAESVQVRIAPLILHPLMVIAMLAVSHVQNKAVISAGAANRHLAPLLFSVLVLSGVGLGRLWQRDRRIAAGLLFAAMAIPGTIGTVATSIARETNQIDQRGECLEWIVPQLRHHADRQATRVIDAIEAIDRGDARFRTLRFDVGALTGPWGDDLMARSQERRRSMSQREALYSVTRLGRRFVLDRPNARGEVDRGAKTSPDTLLKTLHDPTFQSSLGRMAPVERTAFLHGIGLEFEAPRASRFPGLHTRFLETLTRLFHQSPSEYREPIMEGYGFALGLVYDPYNAFLVDHIVALSQLPGPLQQPLARGIAWGYRQRYLEPPRAMPRGLHIVALFDQPIQRAFERAFIGEVLPSEARALEGTEASSGSSHR